MEVSTRFIRDVLRAAEECDVPRDVALAGTCAEFRAALERSSGRVGWGDCAQVIEHIGAVLGTSARIEQFGERTIALNAPSALLHLVPKVVSPSRLLQISFQFVGPAQFPHVRHRLAIHADGTMRLSLSLPHPYAGCETYFRMCVGGIRSIPTIVGYPAALVLTESIGPRGAVFNVTPPPSRTLASRARRAFRALVGENALFDEMARQHEGMQDVFGALLRTQTELKQFMERIPDTLVVHREGVIVWANKALLDAIGYASADDLRGKRVLDFIHPMEKDAATARLAAPLGVAGAGRYRVKAADGSFRTFEVSAPQSVIFEGTPARMAIARDVTERDAMREQLVFADRMSQLGFLAAGVAHEINNPLAYSLAALDRARQDLAAKRLDQAAAALVIASEGAQRVRAITSDLRLFSRGGEQRVEGVEVAQVLRATVDLAAASIHTRGRVVTDVRPMPMVRADEARLGQVFMNLLVNALDALADRDPRTSRIDVRAFTDGGGRAVVEIEDNGRGIPPDLAPRIFDPFFTTKGPRDGSGLGLAICHHIVSELGGRIEVSSPPGKGALFRVLLPPYSGEPSRPERPRSPERRLRILVVDDEALLANAVGRMLEEVHDVEVVASGEEALKRAEAAGADYDVILCDLMMPGVGGMDLYERLAQDRPRLASRIVFMTGGAFSTRARKFLGDVPNTCLDKPFTVEKVLEAIEQTSRAETGDPGRELRDRGAPRVSASDDA